MDEKPKSMFVTSLIDMDLWDRAGWLGVAFLGWDDQPPGMGLLFQDATAARTIFADLIAGPIGREDRFEQLRVSIIEGDVPGVEPGYTVYLGSDYEGVKSRVESQGGSFEGTIMTSIGRFHRMHPAAGSPNLLNFKRDYARSGKYLLLPVVMRGGDAEPLLELAILKTKLHFKDAGSLGEREDESVILRQGREELGKQNGNAGR